MTNTISKIIHNGDEFEFDTSSVSGITTTQPSNPSEGAMYYDTTNDVVKVYDGTNWNVVGDDAADINTKTFYLSSTSDLTNAQAAYDWYVAGKNPIIFYNETTYILAGTTGKEFISTSPTSSTESSTGTKDRLRLITLTVSGSTVTTITASYKDITGPYLKTNYNYSYTPTYDGSPATKKYVDDSVSGAISAGTTAPSNPTEGQIWYDTTNDVVKVYDGTNWVEVGKEYNAGEGIEIGTYDDYSAMRGPCPKGFHIPTSTEARNLLVTTTFGITAAELCGYLKSGRIYSRDKDWGQALTGGLYIRTSTPSGTENANVCLIHMNGATGIYISVKATAYYIRPFKDTPVIPDSSWTMLYDGSSVASGAGIFWNPASGLISVSKNGTTWTTITDKNLGATTVYNTGDVITTANTGYVYQRGNNYGFEYSTTPTTSSTQVDATNYGPGNYYESSTFITGNNNWSNVQNDNLWGATTGVVTLDNAINNRGVLSVNGQTGNVVIPEGTNTKVFTISGQGDTTTGQQIYDYYKAGNTPFVKYNNTIYKLVKVDSAQQSVVDLYFEGLYEWADGATFSELIGYTILIEAINDLVTDTYVMSFSLPFIEPNFVYTQPYIPQYPGSPATKKYVDDHDTVISGDSGTTYTIKVSNSAPASGTPNSTITFVI